MAHQPFLPLTSIWKVYFLSLLSILTSRGRSTGEDGRRRYSPAIVQWVTVVVNFRFRSSSIQGTCFTIANMLRFHFDVEADIAGYFSGRNVHTAQHYSSFHRGGNRNGYFSGRGRKRRPE